MTRGRICDSMPFYTVIILLRLECDTCDWTINLEIHLRSVGSLSLQK